MTGAPGHARPVPDGAAQADVRPRRDPVDALLQGAARGDGAAAAALVDGLAARVHGLALEVTGSSATAQRVSVAVLRGTLREAGRLSSSPIPGEVAALDQARRAIVADSAARGDVRSLVAAATADGRRPSPREQGMIRALLSMPPARRVLLERAALGRFPAGEDRRAVAAELAAALASLRPAVLAAPEDPATAAPARIGDLALLAALDALALADAGERERLRELTRSPQDGAVRAEAITVAAALTELTARRPGRDLRPLVLADLSPRALPAAPPAREYTGTYETPVLGSENHRRQVGPPALIGAPGRTGPGTASTGSAPSPAPAHPAPVPSPTPPGAEEASAPPAAPPAFAFSAASPSAARSSRPERSARAADARGAGATRAGSGRAWSRRLIAALAVVGLLVCGTGWFLADRDREDAEEAQRAWARIVTAPGASVLEGRSDNGTWRAATSSEGTVLLAQDVAPYGRGEVLQLWAQREGMPVDLGVLAVDREGTISFHGDEGGELLLVTRERAPGSATGTPSQQVVAELTPSG